MLGTAKVKQVRSPLMAFAACMILAAGSCGTKTSPQTESALNGTTAIAEKTAASPKSDMSGEFKTTQSQACLNYEPALVTLKGDISIQDFASDVHEGQTERYLVLNLRTPICTNAAADWDVAETNITRLQLLVLSDSKGGNPVPGTVVELQGRLTHAITAYHHTAVLMEIADIKTASAIQMTGAINLECRFNAQTTRYFMYGSDFNINSFFKFYDNGREDDEPEGATVASATSGDVPVQLKNEGSPKGLRRSRR